MIGRGLTEDQALVEIGEALAAVGPGQPRREALAYAAARFVDDATDAATAITTLLGRAGADLHQARTICAQRGSSFLVQ